MKIYFHCISYWKWGYSIAILFYQRVDFQDFASFRGAEIWFLYVETNFVTWDDGSTVLACYGWLWGGFRVQKVFTPQKFNRSPLKSNLPKRKGSSSNHHLSGAMLNFGGVSPFFLILLAPTSFASSNVAGLWVCSRCSIWWWRGRGGSPCNWHRGPLSACFLRFFFCDTHCLRHFELMFFAPSPDQLNLTFIDWVEVCQRRAGAGWKGCRRMKAFKRKTAPLHLLQPSFVSPT